MNEVEESAFIKRVEEVLENMPDKDEASLILVKLVEKVQETPTLAVMELEQLEALYQNDQTNKPSDSVNTSLRTQAVVDSFLKLKQYKRVKEGTEKTYKKHLHRFAKQFPDLPLKNETIMDYLNQYSGKTGRYKRNQHDLLNMLYKHALRSFEIPQNPFKDIERPIITRKPIHTLSL